MTSEGLFSTETNGAKWHLSPELSCDESHYPFLDTLLDTANPAHATTNKRYPLARTPVEIVIRSRMISIPRTLFFYCKPYTFFNVQTSFIQHFFFEYFIFAGCDPPAHGITGKNSCFRTHTHPWNLFFEEERVLVHCRILDKDDSK